MQQNDLLTEELKKQRDEISFLANLIEDLFGALSAIFDSLTWKFGYSIAQLFRRLPLVKKGPLVEDAVIKAKSEYRYWKHEY